MKYKGFEFLWFDFWVGWFYDQKKKVLYICPLPCCVFKFAAAEQTRAVDGAVCANCEDRNGNCVPMNGAGCSDFTPRN